MTKNINKLDISKLNFTKTNCGNVKGMCIDIKSKSGISKLSDYSFDKVFKTKDIVINIDFSPIYSYLLRYDINKIKLKIH